MDKKFLKYMNPEHSEIVDNLPPSFFVTSKGDFLNNYTLMYHKKLKKKGIATKLIYYGEDKLGHAFVTMQPWIDQSQDAIDKMIAWFENQAANKATAAKSSSKKTTDSTGTGKTTQSKKATKNTSVTKRAKTQRRTTK